MPTSAAYDVRVRTAVEAFFPTLSPEAKSAVVWLIVDVLLSLDMDQRQPPEGLR